MRTDDVSMLILMCSQPIMTIQNGLSHVIGIVNGVFLMISMTIFYLIAEINEFLNGGQL